MDPSTIAALSSAPSSVLLAWLIWQLVKDRRLEHKNFLRALAAERDGFSQLTTAIQAMSAVLLIVLDNVIPTGSRSKLIQEQISKLYPSKTREGNGEPLDEEQ